MSLAQVRINRGNHEDVFMNLVSREAGGGFYHEVTSKYNAETYELFAAAFKRLSLATVVNDEARFGRRLGCWRAFGAVFVLLRSGCWFYLVYEQPLWR